MGFSEIGSVFLLQSPCDSRKFTQGKVPSLHPWGRRLKYFYNETTFLHFSSFAPALTLDCTKCVNLKKFRWEMTAPRIFGLEKTPSFPDISRTINDRKKPNVSLKSLNFSVSSSLATLKKIFLKISGPRNRSKTGSDRKTAFHEFIQLSFSYPKLLSSRLQNMPFPENTKRPVAPVRDHSDER